MVSTAPVYIFSAVFASVFLLIAALISNAIKFQGGANPNDPRKRKFWFWTLGIIGTVSFLLFGLFNFYFSSNNNYAKSQLITAIGIGSAICFVAYIVLGFVLSRVFKNGKLGNWFILIWGLFLASSCASNPTKCECKAELHRALQIGRSTELSDECDRVYGDVRNYMDEDCSSSK